MRVYLDNCVFNRPFDDQSQLRIKNETDAIDTLRERIVAGEIELVWSYLNEFEASRNPFSDIRESVFEWRLLAGVLIAPSLSVLKIAYDLRDMGLKRIDSLHVAAAVEANSDYFVSTDDGILSKVKDYQNLCVRNPIDFVSVTENR